MGRGTSSLTLTYADCLKNTIFTKRSHYYEPHMLHNISGCLFYNRVRGRKPALQVWYIINAHHKSQFMSKENIIIYSNVNTISLSEEGLSTEPLRWMAQ